MFAFVHAFGNPYDISAVYRLVMCYFDPSCSLPALFRTVETKSQNPPRSRSARAQICAILSLRLSPAQPMGKAYAPCLAAGETRKLNRVTSNSVFEIGELRSVNGVMTRPISYAQWPFRMHALV